jgi:serine/threonine protein kinase
VTLDLPLPSPLREIFTQVTVKLCDFGFARAITSPLERFTQVTVKLCDFGFARAITSPGEIYTGNCEAL